MGKRRPLKKCGPLHKVIFKKYEDALVVALKGSGKWGGPFRVYDCMEHWHVSSRPADRYGLPKRGKL